jgi:6-phosphogluconolactonase
MTAPSGSGHGGYVVGTWTFTDPDIPLDTACYELRIDGAATVRQISASAVAVYYCAVEPGGRSILLLHNDIHRSAMSRHRFAADGSLAEEGRWSSGGQGGSYIAFDPSGRYFVVANAHTGWAVFRNGTEPELIASLRNEGSGPHPRQGRSHPHCAIFTRDNAWIYAADMGSDEVLAFPFDPDAGRVGDKIRAYRAAPGSGPRHVLSRHGLIYLLNELGNTLVVLRLEGDGTLTEVQSVSTLPSDFTGDSHTAHLDMSRDGRHLYASNRGHHSLTVYDVGAEGLVTPRQWIPSGGKWPWFFALTDDSRMIVANNLSDAMTIFDIDIRGGLRASDHVTVRRPTFITPFGACLDRGR